MAVTCHYYIYTEVERAGLRHWAHRGEQQKLTRVASVGSVLAESVVLLIGCNDCGGEGAGVDIRKPLLGLGEGLVDVFDGE